MSAPETPELDKQLAVIESGAAPTVQDFIDWLDSNGYSIHRRCRLQHGSWYCASCKDMGVVGPVSNYEQLMSEFFGIDRDKIEDERRALLDYVRSNQAGPVTA